MNPERPCRTCTDFKTWAKLQKKTYDSEKIAQKYDEDGTAIASNRKRLDCPLDKDELGSATWSFLHTMAAYYPDKPTSQESIDMKTFFNVFSKFYPCAPCAEDLRQQLKKTPPQTESQKELSQWLCKIHNEVNKKLGKKLFDCKLVDQRWKDGWLDGSCD
ncbi:FAD-linked sulfhydryl oxidase ALR [Chelonus insularis]|uniref:FAD-linked sulfhydryl oxidase ALR n=1 Tax=Chelonus insularis TaxID=460826 RepID=UPI001588A23B|nr:FAD-linked sulfhydryl oxidase ALR [Chelonus insularis]